MIVLSSTAGMLAAMRTARRIDFSTYVLWPGPVERALENAVKRGAEVHVRLEGRLYRGTAAMRQANSDALHRLRRVKADVRMVDRTNADGPSLHLKATVCDDDAYLDDCNWNGGDAVIRDDDAAGVAAIRAAALHCPQDPPPGLALNKTTALRQEAGVLEKSHAKQVDLETEAIGRTGVSKAIRDLTARGVRCRLLLSKNSVKSDSKAIASLERAGIEVRALSKSEKFAVAGDCAWIGSADATSPFLDPDQIEWGLGTRDSHIVDALQTRFNANWREAKRV